MQSTETVTDLWKYLKMKQNNCVHMDIRTTFDLNFWLVFQLPNGIAIIAFCIRVSHLFETYLTEFIQRHIYRSFVNDLLALHLSSAPLNVFELFEQLRNGCSCVRFLLHTKVSYHVNSLHFAFRNNNISQRSSQFSHFVEMFIVHNLMKYF